MEFDVQTVVDALGNEELSPKVLEAVSSAGFKVHSEKEFNDVIGRASESKVNEAKQGFRTNLSEGLKQYGLEINGEGELPDLIGGHLKGLKSELEKAVKAKGSNQEIDKIVADLKGQHSKEVAKMQAAYQELEQREASLKHSVTFQNVVPAIAEEKNTAAMQLALQAIKGSLLGRLVQKDDKVFVAKSATDLNALETDSSYNPIEAKDWITSQLGGPDALKAQVEGQGSGTGSPKGGDTPSELPSEVQTTGQLYEWLVAKGINPNSEKAQPLYRELIKRKK